MDADERRRQVVDGRTTLGIELGSTRIKAVLVDESLVPIASGAHEWENAYVDGRWTYSLDAVETGLRAAYADLVADVERQYGVTPTTFRAAGVSAMMHGYLAFDADGQLLVPFRTWRNTSTGPAAERLSAALGFNIPQRWSIAHLAQAVLDDEPHVAELAGITTLAGYVHRRLTGRDVLGVGDASGVFPIDSTPADSGPGDPGTRDWDDTMLRTAEDLIGLRDLRALLPEVLVAGDDAGTLTPGAPPCSTRPAPCSRASRSARPRATRGPAWSRRTPSRPAPATSAWARASSPWWCSSTRSGPRTRNSTWSPRRPGTPWRWCTATTARARSRAGRGCSAGSPRPRASAPAARRSTSTPCTRRCWPRPSTRTPTPAACCRSTTSPASPSRTSRTADPCCSAHPAPASPSATSSAPRCTARSPPSRSAWRCCTARTSRSTG